MGPELQDVVDEVSHLLGAPATLEDRWFHLVAFGAQTASIDAVRQTSILQRESPAATRAWFEQFGIASSDAPVLIPASDEAGIQARICLPARAGGITHGYLWVVADELPRNRLLTAAMELAGRAGRLLARSAREQQVREERLADLYGDDRAAASRAAGELVDAGLLRHGERVVVAALRTVGGLDAEREPVHVSTGLLPHTVLRVGLRGHAVLLVPLRDDTGLEPARAAVRAVLRETRAAVAGIGSPRRDPATLHESWTEARLAAHVAAAVPSRGPVAEWLSLGAYRLLGAASEAAIAGAVLDEPVRALLDSADERLADTARCYLAAAGNVKATAAELQIHRQTLYYRLRKIEQLTGLDLGDGEDRLRLHLGLVFGALAAPHAASERR
jgi:sugar diacid utilization regulator